MPNQPEHTLDDHKSKYLTAFITHRVADIADLALNGNADAVSLFVYYIERAMGGAEADEQGIVDYWRALRRVEDAFQAQNLPA